MEFRFLRIKRQNMKFSSPITAFSGSIEIAILFRFCPTLYLFGTQSFRGKAIAFCKFRSSDLNESDGTRPARFFLSDMEHIRSFGKKQSLRISLFKWREFYIQNALVLYHKLLSPTYDTFRTKGARNNQIKYLFVLFSPSVLSNNSTSASTPLSASIRLRGSLFR